MEPVRLPRAPADPGAPRLSWPGRPTGDLVVTPARPEPSFVWGGAPAGRVLLGDNRALLAGLSPAGARLAYLDPPFFSGDRYSYRTRVGETRWEVPAFSDTWRDLSGYLGFLEDRLRLVARALSADGSLYVHLDASASHYVKVLLDEILGAERFSRQIVWRIGWVSGFKARARNWVRNHDVLLYYARPGAPFHRTLLPHPEGYRRRGGGEGAGRPLDDVWVDLPSIQILSYSGEKTGWATQKNLALLERVIRASSDPGDTVLDPFGGAGSTAVAAVRTGRRFVTMDASPLAVHLTRRRLLEAGAAFEVAGAPAALGPLEVSREETAAGVVVRLEGASEARGPLEVAPLDRLDGWWVAEAGAPERPLWQVHREGGRRPGRVAVASAPLRARGPLVVEAVDLAGGRHRAHL